MVLMEHFYDFTRTAEPLGVWAARTIRCRDLIISTSTGNLHTQRVCPPLTRKLRRSGLSHTPSHASHSVLLVPRCSPVLPRSYIVSVLFLCLGALQAQKGQNTNSEASMKTRRDERREKRGMGEGGGGGRGGGRREKKDSDMVGA
jgi:hypothetical protein